MKVCAIFGVRDTTYDKLQSLYETMYLLVKEWGVDFFFVGREGDFDEIAETALFNLCTDLPHVGYNVVFCAETEEKFTPFEIYTKSLAPMFRNKQMPREKVIKKLNQWMINEADCVMLYAPKTNDEISELQKYAERKKKQIYLVR